MRRKGGLLCEGVNGAGGRCDRGICALSNPHTYKAGSIVFRFSDFCRKDNEVVRCSSPDENSLQCTVQAENCNRVFSSEDGGYFAGKREVIGGKPKCYYPSGSVECNSCGEGSFQHVWRMIIHMARKPDVPYISVREPILVYL